MGQAGLLELDLKVGEQNKTKNKTMKPGSQDMIFSFFLL